MCLFSINLNHVYTFALVKPVCETLSCCMGVQFGNRNDSVMNILNLVSTEMLDNFHVNVYYRMGWLVHTGVAWTEILEHVFVV